MPLSQKDVALIVARYEPLRPKFERVASEVARLVHGALLQAGVARHMLTSRAKGPDSLSRTLWRKRETLELANIGETLAPPLKDLAGIRALLYLPQDVSTAVAAVQSLFPNARHKPMRDGGYQADHFLATLEQCREPKIPDIPEDALRLQFELQVCTLTEHVWNELEHDIRYKQPDGKPDEGQHELLQSLRAELDLTSATLKRLIERTDLRRIRNKTRVDSPDELRLYLENRQSRKKGIKGDIGDLFELLDLMMIVFDHAGLDTLFDDGCGEVEAIGLVKKFDPDGATRDLGMFSVQALFALGHERVTQQVSAHEDPPPLWKFLLRVAGSLSKD